MLLYADVIVLLASNEQDIQSMLNVVNDVFEMENAN